MIDSVGREAQKVVDSYDRRREAQELADGARNAVAAAAAVGAGALGLGTIVTVAATTAAADVTGIILASVLAAIGFFILPAKRQQAKAEMRGKIADVRARLSTALREQFQREIHQQRRADPRRHRPLQPVRQGRRGQAEGCRSGVARNRERAGRAPRARRSDCGLSWFKVQGAGCKARNGGTVRIR